MKPSPAPPEPDDTVSRLQWLWSQMAREGGVTESIRNLFIVRDAHEVGTYAQEGNYYYLDMDSFGGISTEGSLVPSQVARLGRNYEEAEPSLQLLFQALLPDMLERSSSTMAFRKPATGSAASSR